MGKKSSANEGISVGDNRAMHLARRSVSAFLEARASVGYSEVIHSQRRAFIGSILDALQAGAGAGDGCDEGQKDGDSERDDSDTEYAARVSFYVREVDAELF